MWRTCSISLDGDSVRRTSVWRSLGSLFSRCSSSSVEQSVGHVRFSSPIYGEFSWTEELIRRRATAALNINETRPGPVGHPDLARLAVTRRAIAITTGSTVESFGVRSGPIKWPLRSSESTPWPFIYHHAVGPMSTGANVVVSNTIDNTS